MREADILLKSAKAYERLINKEYLVTVGKNAKLKTYVLRFTPDEFKHLFGLHKLTDRPAIFRASSDHVFKELLNNETRCVYIASSRDFPKIEQRVANIADLEQYIDIFDKMCDWDKLKAEINIKADKMIQNVSVQNGSDKICVFFKDDCIESGAELRIGDIHIGDFNIEVPVSFIVDTRDYSKSLVRPAVVLYKEKHDLSTGAKTVLLDELSPQHKKPKKRNVDELS